MKETNILIIGGGPAGVVAAGTARKYNPDKKITLIRDKQKSVVPCGIPYIFNRLDSVDKNIMGDTPLEKNNVELIIDTAEKLKPEEKTVSLKDNGEIKFEKLILATGSKPIQIPVKGIEKEGVWQIKKDYEYLKQLRENVLSARSIVIIGGGFIGIEIAEELSGISDVEIHLVEKLDHCLATTFDDEFCAAAEEKLKEKGVNIKTGRYVEEILGKEKVVGVSLDNGEKIEVDMVILSIGAKPNVDLIEGTDIKTGKYGGIWVDEYMKTDIPDVFAVGDCAETRDFFTGDHVPVMLASTASMEARVAGANLYQLKVLRENKGSLNTFSTYLDGMLLGVVGLTEKRAASENFEVTATSAECKNHHPGTLPNTKPIILKLIFSKSSADLLGGQVMGPESASELINIIALAMQNKNTAYDLSGLQISTHPLLTPAPTISPIITAAQHMIEKIERD